MTALRYRAGVHGTVNVVLGAVFLPVFAALVVACGIQVCNGVDVGWVLFGGTTALLAAVVVAAMVASGVSSWRPVVLDSTRLSVPGFSFRRGFYRDDIPLADVRDVTLTYFSQPRNGRWHLVVTRRHGPTITCESITSSRSSTRAQGTPASRAVDELRAAIRGAQHPAG